MREYERVSEELLLSTQIGCQRARLLLFTLNQVNLSTILLINTVLGTSWKSELRDDVVASTYVLVPKVCSSSPGGVLP